MSKSILIDGVIRLYFVRSGEIRSNDHMVEAFNTCKEADLTPEWIEERDVNSIKMKPNVVFILNEFKGATFDYLSTKDCLICGPLCITTCIAGKIPIPENQSPVFTIAMMGLVVATSGLRKAKKDSIKRYVGYMGGTYSEDLTLAVTHLVTEGGRTSKCEKAVEANIPIMTCAWVDAVWEASCKKSIKANDPAFDRYRLPPFKGMSITCSNIPRQLKRDMQALIEANGGIYMPNLVQNKTSIVIMGEPEGDKYRHAQMWGIPCVKPAWVQECVARKMTLNTEEYSVHGRPKCSTPTSDLPSFMSNSEISIVPAADTTRSDIDDTMASISSFASGKNPSQKIHPAAAEPAKPVEPPGLDYKKILEDIKLSDALSAANFLDGCKIFLSGFSSPELEKLKKVLNSGRATIFMQVSDRVSHVVTGNFVASDVKAISQLQPRPYVVTLEWILASIRQKSPAPVQPYLCLQNEAGSLPPPSPLSHKGLELLKPKSTPQQAPPSSVSQVSPTDSEPPVARRLFLQTPNHQVPESQSLSQRMPPPKGDAEKRPEDRTQSETSQSRSEETLDLQLVFQGLIFELMDIDDVDKVTKAIESGGGIVASKGFHGIPDYAVVPWAGTCSRVSAGEAVNVLWIEECIDKGQLLKVEYYHRPSLLKEGERPLIGSAICLSGFSGKERTFLVYMLNILGARVQDSLSRRDHPEREIVKTTHLVCSEAKGVKYQAGIRWGLPIVNKNWIIQSAKSGKMEPAHLYPVTPGSGGSTPSQTPGNKTVEGTPANRVVPDTEGNSTPIAATPQFFRAQADVQPSPSMFATPAVLPPKVSNGSIGHPGQGIVIKRKLSHPSVTPPADGDGGSSAKKRGFSQEFVQNENRTPLNLREKLGDLSVGLSPFHVDTPESPYGRVFGQDDPSPGTRKRWKKYIDGFPDFYEGSPQESQNSRRLSTPLSLIKNQLRVKFCGAEIDGLDPETGDVLPEGPFKQWYKKDSEASSGFADKSTEPAEVTDSDKKVTEQNGTHQEDIKKRIVSDDFVAATPASTVKNTKKFVKKKFKPSGTQDENKNEAMEINKDDVAPELQRQLAELKAQMKPLMVLEDGPDELEEQFKNFDGTMNTVTEEMRRSIANRFAPTDSDSEDDADEQLKISAAKANTEIIENVVTWDFERPEVLKELAGKNPLVVGKKFGAKEKKNRAILESDSQLKPDVEEPRRPIEGPKTSEKKRPEQPKASEVKKKQPEEPKTSERKETGRKSEDEEDGILGGPEKTQVVEGPKKIFTLSNINQNSREKYENIIKNLGGEVSVSNQYDEKSTHIVIDKPVRSEKLLCSIASGKWVLHMSYLDQCYESRTFLPEEDFEWGNPRGEVRLPQVTAGSQEANLARAAFKWRQRVSELGSRALPFRDMKVVLLTVPGKTPQYTRLLLAGGATILSPQKIMEATHCFVDEGKVKIPVKIEQLVRKEIHCVPPVFLGDCLTKSPPPVPSDYWIESYRKAR